MTVETDIFDTLRGFVADRVFPDVGPANVARPYITYQQVGGAPANFLAGIPSKRGGRFQFNAWDTTRMGASALIRQVEDALRLSTVLRATTEAGAVSIYEEDTQLYGARQDFAIWFDA